MEAVSKYADKSARRVIGVSASATGIDAAALTVSGAGASTQISLLRFRRTTHPAEVRNALARALSAECPGLDVSRLNFGLGHLLAEAAGEVVRGTGGALCDIDVIGCGGLTLYRAAASAEPDDLACPPSILQIGEPAVVAEETGVTTVGDFGVTDVAAGGTGLGLIPFADFVLFHHSTKTRAVQTIGRTASVTLLPAGDDPERVVAFDTGPGHGVMDAITELVSEGKLLSDHDGRLASLGHVNPALLEHMMAHAFIQRQPPKAASGADFGPDFLTGVLDLTQSQDITVEDLLATATAFTAESIGRSYQEFLAPQFEIDELILGGGGSYNATLRRMLKARLPGLPVYLHEDFGIYGEAKQALGLAILANETMLGRSSHLPGATGAARPRPLGKIILAAGAPQSR